MFMNMSDVRILPIERRKILIGSLEARTSNLYDLPEWEHPDYYGGYSPERDYVLYSQSRDSDILTQSNYIAMLKLLEEKETELEQQHMLYAEDIEGEFDQEKETAIVHDFRARHWACGWVECIIMRRDAPMQLQQLAYEILGGLENHPVIDDEDFCERETEERQEYWDNMDLREKINLLAERGDNIFAARRESIFDLPDNTYQRLCDLVCY